MDKTKKLNKKQALSPIRDLQFNLPTKEEKAKEEVDPEMEGYIPSAFIKPPKMMILPTQEELRSMIRSALEDMQGSRAKFNKSPS